MLPIPTAFCGYKQWSCNHASFGIAASYITDNREGCLTVHLRNEIKRHDKVMGLGYFIFVSLARNVSGTYACHQEHYILSCSIWFSAPNIWMCGGLESHYVRCGCCHARNHSHRTHDLRRGSPNHHPSKYWVRKTICCNSKSNALHDGRIYPKHVELRIQQ